MRTLRDTQLRARVRQRNWLRVEVLRRYISVRYALFQALVHALSKERRLSGRSHVFLQQWLTSIPRKGRIAQHTTRCRVTGRANQASRVTQLARMEFRRAMAEGGLPDMQLSRSK